MRFFVMFVTAVCVLFLIKLRWPKKKNFYKMLSCLVSFLQQLWYITTSTAQAQASFVRDFLNPHAGTFELFSREFLFICTVGIRWRWNLLVAFLKPSVNMQKAFLENTSPQIEEN